MGISENQFSEIVYNLKKFSIPNVSSKEERIEYLFDLFKMIFADHKVDEQERKLIHKYAIGLGCTEKKAKEVISKSIKIFGGELSLDEYKYLIGE